MTRLVEDDIRHIRKTIKEYDNSFKRQTGYSMKDVAACAAETVPSENCVTAVVPFTCGQGIISGFAEAVCAILKYCDVPAFVTEKTDVNGIYEAVLRQADIIFMADDERFVAFGVSEEAMAENGKCTGEGFAEALLRAMEEERNEKVLVLGASAVGSAAADYLLKRGIAVDMYDIDYEMLERADVCSTGLTKLKDRPVFREYKYLYDATTASGLISDEDVGKDTVIAAPGMPLGVTEQACKQAKVIHNPLELGVMTMYYNCLGQMLQKESR